MLPFMICLLVAAAGIALILLARLVRSYPLAFVGLVVVLTGGVLAIVLEGRMLLGVFWIVFSLFSVVFAGLWLYKNKRWAFWWSFGADAGIILAAVFASAKMDELSKTADLIKAVAIPAGAFIVVGIVCNLLFNLLVPALQHKNKYERKHLTNIDPLIGQKLTIYKDAAEGRPARGQLGDVDWSVGPFFPGESFKTGDVVVIKQIKGVTLLVVRDGKDYRKEMKEKRKAEAEEARKGREEAQAKKAAEKAKKEEEKKEEPKVEEPAPAPVVEEPAPQPEPEPEPIVEEPAPQPEPEPEPVVEEPTPQPEPEPVVEEPAPVVEEPAKKEKAEFVPFAVRLHAADDFLKESYNELKSEVLSYGIKSRVSSAGDKFRLHTKTYVKMVIAGKYLKLYFALNPEDYKDTTYPFEDASRMGAHKDTPFVFKIKSGLSVRRAKILIKDAASKDGLTQGEVVKHDHVADVKVEENSSEE